MCVHTSVRAWMCVCGGGGLMCVRMGVCVCVCVCVECGYVSTETYFLMFFKIRGENLLPCTTCNHGNFNTPSCLNSLISHQPYHLQIFRRCNTSLSNFLVILFLSSFSFIYHTSKIWKDVVTSCSDVNDCRRASIWSCYKTYTSHFTHVQQNNISE